MFPPGPVGAVLRQVASSHPKTDGQTSCAHLATRKGILCARSRDHPLGATGVPTRYWEGAPSIVRKLPNYFFKLHVTAPARGCEIPFPPEPQSITDFDCQISQGGTISL